MYSNTKKNVYNKNRKQSTQLEKRLQSAPMGEEKRDQEGEGSGTERMLTR